MGYNKIKKVLCLVAMAVLMVGCGNNDGEHDDTTVDENEIEVTKFSMPEEIPKSDKVEFVNLTLNTTEAYYIEGAPAPCDIDYKSLGYKFLSDEEMENYYYYDPTSGNGDVVPYLENSESECVLFSWGKKTCSYVLKEANKYMDCIVPYKEMPTYNLYKYAEKKEFDFATEEDALEAIGEVLGFDFSKDWYIETFYLEHKILEQEKYGNSYEDWIDGEHVWSSKDDAYMFYIRPSYCGLPCFYQINGGEGFEAYNYQIFCVYNKNGIVELRIRNLMPVQISGEEQELLPFEEIVDIVFDEYDSLLDDYTYKITGATLFCHANDKKVYPAWHFDLTTTDGDKLEFTIPIMVNAITGEFMKDPL